MVMRNRHDGANTPNWWDDLPPGLRKRFANTSQRDPSAREELRQSADRDPVPYRPGVVRDLSRLAALFFLVAVANLLFLLIALTFRFGGGPLPR